MSGFQCVYASHQYEEITGICLFGCNQRPWVCMRCIIEKHKTHQDKCKTFSQIISLIEDACRYETDRQHNELRKIEELIGISKLVVQETESNLNKYRNWITQIRDQHFKSLNITQLIDTLKYKRTTQDIKQKGCNSLLGKDLIQQSQYFEALSFYEKVITDNIEPVYGKGECLLNLTQYKEAEKCFDQVLDANPNHIESLFGKGECLRMIDKDQEAVTYYNKILKIDPNHFASLLSKGQCLRYLQHLDEALQCLEQALQINPKSWQALFEKGFKLFNKVIVQKRRRNLKKLRYILKKLLHQTLKIRILNMKNVSICNTVVFCKDPHRIP